MVNVPDFTLKVVDDHKTLFHTRIVVGKPNTPSPSFSAAIENILVNPTWHVPQSIIYNEYLPALEQDPGVLTRMGLVMDRAADGSISIRQPPSERNALGRIKFNFPNRYQVYLHDTPDKKLFAQERRAYSHGCMRVQNPTQFGEVLLSLAQPPELRYSADRLQRMFGSGEQWLNFKKKIPVHVTYMNAYVDDAGKLVVREDLYGYDARVRSALRGEYMAIAERSQKVTPGVIPASASNSARRIQARRQVVQEQPRRGGFFFPWFQ
jgi:murein L,D-transpeptidase YcbB/YkuD